MTSGKFASFPIEAIWVNRELRQRRELTGIEELADSIKRIGLINPLAIKKDGELKAGERRWNAVKLLGWTSVSVQFIEDMDELELQLLELEENTRRMDLPWQDQCLAVKKYHDLQSQLHPEWTQTATGDALGMKQAEVSSKISVAEELSVDNTRVIFAPRYSVARGIVKRAAERKRTSIIESINPTEEELNKVAPILNTDFNEWMKSYAGPKFNFIHCDFPYGVDADGHDQGAAASFGGYKDTIGNYNNLLISLSNAMSNVVSESAHLMFWFSMKHYAKTILHLENMGWKVNPFPLIWYKSDNMGILPDPERGPRQIYETCFMASRGDRKIIRAVSNVVAAPTTKTIHMSEKPVNMLTKFMEMFVDEYSMVLDPTCGSANSLKAAESRGASVVLGLELGKEFFDLAREHYYRNDELD